MLTKEEIGLYLSEIDQKLFERGLTGEVVLCGGAVMAYVFDARQSTKDIDALFAPTAELREIAAEVAQKYNLETDWFNDAAKGFIDTSRMELETVEQMKSLKVMRPDDKAMLAMKLASAREDSKDAADSIFLIRRLGIHDENDLLDIVEKNIPSQRLTPMAYFFAKEMLKNAWMVNE